MDYIHKKKFVFGKKEEGNVKILGWMSREGGEWGTESEDLGQRQVENLMELLPDALRWSREKQSGGWGI